MPAFTGNVAGLLRLADVSAVVAVGHSNAYLGLLEPVRPGYREQKEHQQVERQQNDTPYRCVAIGQNVLLLTDRQSQLRQHAG